MQTYEILVDSREKRPFQFPATLEILHPSTGHLVRVSLRERQIHLPVADYALDGQPGVCYSPSGFGSTVIVERKGSLDEIGVNCLDSMRRARFVRALQRHRAACAHPYLVVDGGLDCLCSGDRAPVDALLRLSVEYGVPIVPLPANTPAQRARAAEYVARLLIAGIIARPVNTNGSPLCNQH